MSQIFSPRARSSDVSGPLPNQGRCMEPFAAGMRDLDAGHHILRLHEGRDASQRRNVRRRPQSQVAVGDAALRGHCRGLDEDAGRATERQPAKVGEVEILGDAVDRRVSRHGCDDDAVLERDALNCDGCEEQRLYHVRIRPSAPATWSGDRTRPGGRLSRVCGRARSRAVAPSQPSGRDRLSRRPLGDEFGHLGHRHGLAQIVPLSLAASQRG